MAVSFKHDDPAPPPKLLEVRMVNGIGKVAFAQRGTPGSSVYICANAGFYPADEAIEWAEGIIRLARGQE